MFEESVSNTIPSIWASMNSWFTPAVLFVLLNVMIGTIAFTSILTNQKQHQHQHQHRHRHHQHQQQNYQNDAQQQQPKLARTPSVLQRLRSINFYNCASNFRTTPDSHTHYTLDHTHQDQQHLEAHSQYIFEQTQVQETNTHYFFDQIHPENTQTNPTHFVFQQTHQENTQKNPPHFGFEPSHERTGQENSNLFSFDRIHEENAQENGTLLDFERVQEENVEDEEGQSLDEVYSQLEGRHVSRSKPDTKPTGGQIPVRLPTKMKKSASLKSPSKHFEEEDIVEARRPMTVRERGTARETQVDDEVDAKADDFINNFKQQLKLQRLDSILGRRI